MVDNPRRILIIDDNAAIHSDFRRTLMYSGASRNLAAVEAALFAEPGVESAAACDFQIDSAMRGEEGVRKVQEALERGERYAMAFVDMRMPAGWDGLETVQRIWQADGDIQVVICTAYSDYSWDEIIAALGTTDQLLILKKPFDTTEVRQLAAALTEKWRLKLQARMKVDELERLIFARTSELRRQALQDKLTGLPNRGCFSELLERAIENNHEKPGFKFAVHFLDCDRFKIVNDSLGHEVGDSLLISIADRLRQVTGFVPGSEGGNCAIVAARQGGDEFTILQTGLSCEQDATDLAGRLLKAIALPHDLHGTEVQCTASIGIALCDARHDSSEDYLRDADTAMYRAKARGAGQYVVFTEEMHEAAVKRLTVEAELRRALETFEEFQLVCQPILALDSGALESMECLVRWTSRSRGALPPDSFIPVAEETGLIVRLGRWVLEEACKQIRDLTAELGHEINMAVNISRRQLTDPTLVEQVAECLERYKIKPKQLVLEITESIMMGDELSTKDVLPRLCGLGVALHMDDFGTGYSSLSCLHQFPIGAIKIDRSFVKTAANRRDYVAVINSIVQLAHNLDIKVIAEGIETPTQAAMLQAMECDYGQGYLFSKPLPAGLVADFIRGLEASPMCLRVAADMGV